MQSDDIGISYDGGEVSGLSVMVYDVGRSDDNASDFR